MDMPETIIRKIEHARVEIIRLYQSVPVTALIEPAFLNGWSVKDVLAHMAAWEQECADLLNQAHETSAPFAAAGDTDARNREIYQEREEWSWSEVEQEFRQAHENLLAAIRQLPPGRLEDPVVQENIAGETWEHYAEHLPQLQRWHKGVTR